MFNTSKTVIRVKCLCGKGSSPEYVLRKAKEYISRNQLRKTDEIWLVVDKDNWTDSQLNNIFFWTDSANNRSLALSNPCFELWLLLHFEDATPATAEECIRRLKRFLPNYDKSVKYKDFLSKISNAIQRAKTKDQPPCRDYPRAAGTTVYRLVEKLHQPGEPT